MKSSKKIGVKSEQRPQKRVKPSRWPRLTPREGASTQLVAKKIKIKHCQAEKVVLKLGGGPKERLLLYFVA